MSSQPGNPASLYLRVPDTEIAAVPLSISDKAAADWLGVDVDRVRRVRAALSRKREERPHLHDTPASHIQAYAEQSRRAVDAEDGSKRLLRRMLVTGQHYITDMVALAKAMRAAGVA